MTTPANAPAAAPAAATPAAPEPAQSPAVHKTPDAEGVQRAPKPVEKETPAPKIRVRGYERAQRIKEKLLEEEAGGKPAPDEAETPATEPEPAKKPEPAKAGAEEKPEPSADDKRRLERAERIRKAQERERQEAQERAQRSRTSARDAERDREIETMRKRLAELEPMESVFASEEALLEAAEKRGLSAEKLVTWMRKQLSGHQGASPQSAPTRQEPSARQPDPEIVELRRTVEEMRAQQAAEREQYAAVQKANAFFATVRGSAESHPLTAAFQTKYGDAALVNFANQFVAPHLRPDYSLEELHDYVEQLLDEVQIAQATGAPANGASPPPKNGAGQPPTTLGNSVAQQRETVTEAIPLHKMTREERFRYLEDKYKNE